MDASRGAVAGTLVVTAAALAFATGGAGLNDSVRCGFGGGTSRRDADRLCASLESGSGSIGSDSPESGTGSTVAGGVESPFISPESGSASIASGSMSGMSAALGRSRSAGAPLAKSVGAGGTGGGCC